MLLFFIKIIEKKIDHSFFLDFLVTVDYKALCLLLNKAGNEDFHLGGKGYDVEFCAFCDAIRVNHFWLLLFRLKIIVSKQKILNLLLLIQLLFTHQVELMPQGF